MTDLSFCPLLQYLVGHIFNYIGDIRNTKASKFTGPRKSLTAWGTWEEISFYLAVKQEMTEALWTHGDTLEEAALPVSGQGLLKSSGGSRSSCPAPNIHYSARTSPGPLVCKRSDPPEHIPGEKVKLQETLGVRLKRGGGQKKKKKDDLKINHPNYARIMHSCKYMAHIFFIFLNSAFRKGLYLWQRLSQSVWKSSFEKVTFKILKTAF